MRAVLKLEHIGDHYFAYAKYGKRRHDVFEREVWLKGMARPSLKPWVARLTGLDSRYGFKREFVRGVKDYSEATGLGARGVYEYIVLREGVYEINERVSWNRARRYFIRVEESEIEEISKEEVVQWLTDSG